MPVTIASLEGPTAACYRPADDSLDLLEQYRYIEEEWAASREIDGRPYKTTLLVRRPREQGRFSGVVIAEPLHPLGMGAIWKYTDEYIMRSGHGWAVIGSEKTALDTHVKPFDEERYASYSITAPPPPPGLPALDFDSIPNSDPDTIAAMLVVLQHLNAGSTEILAQVGAAIGAASSRLRRRRTPDDERRYRAGGSAAGTRRVPCP